MRKRSEAATPPKPPAADRTVPLPESGALPGKGKAKCSACEEWVDLSKAPRREDGTPECSECGAAIDTDAPAEEPTAPARKPPEERSAAPEKPEAAPESKDVLRGAYCPECASEWLLVGGKRFRNCGHDGEPVDHPLKARRVSPPAGLQGRAKDVPLPSSPATVSAPGVPLAQRVDGNKLFVPWGKARVPIDRWNAIEVGGHSMSIELAPGANVVAEAERALAILQEIADRSFETQWAWYQKKLKIAGYSPE